jgi:hypothetical protein
MFQKGALYAFVGAFRSDKGNLDVDISILANNSDYLRICR